MTAEKPCGAQPVERRSAFAKIVNGKEARENEFGWAITLARRGQFFCGGTLITKMHVLTAAHCVNKWVFRGSGGVLDYYLPRFSLDPLIYTHGGSFSFSDFMPKNWPWPLGNTIGKWILVASPYIKLPKSTLIPVSCSAHSTMTSRSWNSEIQLPSRARGCASLACPSPVSIWRMNMYINIRAYRWNSSFKIVSLVIGFFFFFFFFVAFFPLTQPTCPTKVSKAPWSVGVDWVKARSLPTYYKKLTFRLYPTRIARKWDMCPRRSLATWYAQDTKKVNRTLVRYSDKILFNTRTKI